MERGNVIKIFRLTVSAILAACIYFFVTEQTARLIGFLAAYLIAGYDVLIESAESLFHGELLDEAFLMILATLGAFMIGEYPEAFFVMAFFQVGELFEDSAQDRSRRAIETLMDIRPDYANLLIGEEVQIVAPSSVEVGSVILVKPGERIPLDGKVLEGTSCVDTSALTGESLPRDCQAGDSILSGCINLSGVLKIEVEKTYGESTVSKILSLIENSAEGKTDRETFIAKFAHWYTPLMVISALILGIAVPLFVGNWSFWLQKACAFLVISCPCALVVSVPLAFFCGIGGASRQGILMKSSSVMEALCKLKTVCFDKTGTLTEGGFQILKILPAQGVEQEHLLYYAAAAEKHSTHPLALCVKGASASAENAQVTQVEELAGSGIRALVDGEEILIGKQSLLEAHNISLTPVSESDTVLYVAKNQAFLGALILGDRLKEDAPDALALLKDLGIEKTVLLTGDRKEAALAVSKTLCISETYSDLLPQDKVETVRRLQKNTQGTTAFVGDGMNDAPVLACADVGVAMGALGSDAAIESADVVLMDDRLTKLALAIRFSGKASRIATMNIVLSLGVKFFIMVLCLLGYAPLAAAVFADVGVLIITVLNATRAMHIK